MGTLISWVFNHSNFFPAFFPLIILSNCSILHLVICWCFAQSLFSLVHFFQFISVHRHSTCSFRSRATITLDFANLFHISQLFSFIFPSSIKVRTANLVSPSLRYFFTDLFNPILKVIVHTILLFLHYSPNSQLVSLAVHQLGTKWKLMAESTAPAIVILRPKASL